MQKFNIKQATAYFKSTFLQHIKSFSQNVNYSVKSQKLSRLKLVGIGLAVLATAYQVKSKPSLKCETVVNMDHVKQQISLEDATVKANELLQRIKDEVGAPGIVAAVSLNGKKVWSKGIGYADVENRVLCGENTVMRIASISKSMAMAIIARLREEGKLNLDAPVNKYVQTWPEKTFENVKVTITTRQLLSHLGGIRHYDKNCGRKTKTEENESEENNKKEEQKEGEFDAKEYHLTTKFDSVKSSLELFQDDKLCSKPGTEFLYTTHGFTLASAVAEGASGKKYSELSSELFKQLGLSNTYLDENDPIIYNRSRYYVKDTNGRLRNAPYVDNSYKWAGGGYLSTVTDLLKFANAMLYSFQQPEHSNNASLCLPGYLRKATMQEMWSPVNKTKCSWDLDGGSYGLGWGVMPKIAKYGQAKARDFYVSHTGGAIGASSVLLIKPATENEQVNQSASQGVVVAILTNMQGVNLNRVALEIANIFQDVKH